MVIIHKILGNPTPPFGWLGHSNTRANVLPPGTVRAIYKMLPDVYGHAIFPSMEHHDMTSIMMI